MPQANTDAPSTEPTTEAYTPDPFIAAFLATGQQVEYRRAEMLVFPSVFGREYQCCIVSCACSDLTVHYVPDPERHINYFYSLCQAHGLQPLGRAERMSKAQNPETTHRRRTSGATTSRWYRSRGW